MGLFHTVFEKTYFRLYDKVLHKHTTFTHTVVEFTFAPDCQYQYHETYARLDMTLGCLAKRVVSSLLLKVSIVSIVTVGLVAAGFFIACEWCGINRLCHRGCSVSLCFCVFGNRVRFAGQGGAREGVGRF